MGKKQQTERQSSSRLHVHFLLREGILILTLAISVFLLLSLTTYHRSDPSWSHIVMASHVANAGGRAGAWIADFFLYIFGYLAYIFPALLSYSAWLYYRNQKFSEDSVYLRWALITMRFIGFILVLATASALLNIFMHGFAGYLPYQAGGILGSLIGIGLESTFNLQGSALILVALLLIGITLFTGLSWFKMMEWIGSGVLIAMRWLISNMRAIRWTELYQKAINAIRSRRTENVKESGIARRVSPQIIPKSVEKTIEKKSLMNKLRKKKRKAEQAVTEAIIPAVSAPQAVTPIVAKSATAPTTTTLAPRVAQANAAPKLSLLDSKPAHQKSVVDTQDIDEQARMVETCLSDFGVSAVVAAIHPGPVVTRFELQLAAGTKVSKITGLVKDLARSLSVTSVRVVEVIPGKSVIGLELPNPTREIVTLQEVLASTQYERARSALTLALGNDIAGHPVIVDLAKMPHLLVAGTTGSGKSVSLNTMLLSLLYKSTPKELRLILIDPKMLELAVYDGIPHLLTPVVTDMKDAANALRWCVAEMERRYRLMASLGVRNIAGYNLKVREAKAQGKPLYNPLKLRNSEEQEQEELQELPQIVVLADEFADMMVVVGKKVETLIARLAQKARAAGVHLILATQRPSVDVITGLIKANIPTRIAFQVSSKVDSRTILDQQGAEQLLGHGDMLYLAPGTGVPVRVHGAFVSDDEVHRVVSFLKKNAEPQYLGDVLDEASTTDPSGFTEAVIGDNDAEQDPLYDEAVDMVARSRKVSVSSIQRRFKIGYNRAARIVEAMEAAGVVSKMESNGLREVLIPTVEG